MTARPDLKSNRAEPTRCNTEIAAARRVAELAEAQIPALERTLSEAESEVVNVALSVFRLERDEAHREVLAAVDALGLALARLLAIDLVREAQTGQRFKFDPARHPPSELWQPRPLVSALLAAMPAQLAPDGWADTVERGARIIADGKNGDFE